MGRTFLFVLMIGLVSGFSWGQIRHLKGTATVKISVPSIEYEYDPDRNDAKLRVYLRGANRSRLVPYVGRRVIKDSLGNDDYHVDEYEANVRPGIYRVILPEYKGHKLANFRVTASEVIQFSIPVIRLSETVCLDNVPMLKTYHFETPLSVQNREYAKPPFSKPKSELLNVSPPFDMSVRYCSKEKRGEKTIYKGAEVYYKTYYVSAPTITLSKNALELEETNTGDETVYVEMNGVEISISERRISLR